MPVAARVAVVVALLAAIIWWVAGRHHDDGMVAVAPASANSTPPIPRAPVAKAPAHPGGGVLRDDTGAIVAERVSGPASDAPFVRKSSPEETARAVEEYRKANQYPSTSQPLGKHNTDLMKPNQRYENPVPSRFDSGIRYLYSGFKNTIVGNEPVQSFLEVTKDGAPMPVKVLAAQARIRGADDVAEIPLAYGAEGNRYTNSFSPAAFGVKRGSIIETEIWFEVGPDQEESRTLRFFYTPSGAVPARFTGRFRDTLEAGSLVIYAGIDVQREGYYLIDCNLYGAHDEPVMFARYKGDLPAGTSEVRLLFYGKALRDQGVPPPYHIGQLRGGRHDPTRDPDIDSMPLANWSYTTQGRFTLDDLTDAEWDSEHKRHMIELIQKYGTKPGSDTR